MTVYVNPTDVAGLSTDADLAALLHGTQYIAASEVEGDVAEFGCFTGKSSQAIAAGLAKDGLTIREGLKRNLWLFDSFQGLPAATHPVDISSPQVASGAWTWTLEIPPISVAMLCAEFLPLERIKIIPGWYKDTLEQLPPTTRLAMVHIDCDFYESTIQVLEYLFKHQMFSDGCMVFFDDWYCNRGSPRFGEQRAWEEMRKKNFYDHGYTFTDVGAYGLMGRRFILHRDDVA